MRISIKETVSEYQKHVRSEEKTGNKRAIREGTERAGGLLRKSLRDQKIDLVRGFSPQELFIECFGYEEFKHARSQNSIDFAYLREAAGAVSTSAFMNIQGQYIFAMFMEAYEDPEFVLTKLIPERQAPNVPGFEKIPGIQRMGNESAVVPEGKDYPIIGTGEDWILFNEPDKKGGIVPVTKEVIFYDRTGLLVSRCQEVGRVYGVQLEIAAADCIIDENVTNHRYNWKGTVIATYGDNSGAHVWDNLSGSNTLSDFTSLNAPYILLRQMTDPYTGLPAMFLPKHLVCDTTLEIQAIATVSAPWTRQHVGGYNASATVNEQEFVNPFARFGITVVATPYLGFRLATDSYWFLGDATKAFVRNVHFPMEVTQAPPNSEDDFKRDIVSQFKVSGKMKFETPQPRAMIKNT